MYVAYFIYHRSVLIKRTSRLFAFCSSLFISFIYSTVAVMKSSHFSEPASMRTILCERYVLLSASPFQSFSLLKIFPQQKNLLYPFVFFFLFFTSSCCPLLHFSSPFLAMIFVSLPMTVVCKSVPTSHCMVGGTAFPMLRSQQELP